MKLKRITQSLVVVALCGALYTEAYVSDWYQQNKGLYVRAAYNTGLAVAQIANQEFDDVEDARVPSVYIDNHEYMESVLESEEANYILPMVVWSYLDRKSMEDVHFEFSVKGDKVYLFTSDQVNYELIYNEDTSEFDINEV